jgi:hypothetical protein
MLEILPETEFFLNNAVHFQKKWINKKRADENCIGKRNPVRSL